MDDLQSVAFMGMTCMGLALAFAMYALVRERSAAELATAELTKRMMAELAIAQSIHSREISDLKDVSASFEHTIARFLTELERGERRLAAAQREIEALKALHPGDAIGSLPTPAFADTEVSEEGRPDPDSPGESAAPTRRVHLR